MIKIRSCSPAWLLQSCPKAFRGSAEIAQVVARVFTREFLLTVVALLLWCLAMCMTIHVNLALTGGIDTFTCLPMSEI